MISTIPSKTFFKIGEVAKIVGVKPHVLRYWESEFRRIRTSKTKTGQRLFKRRDIFYLMAIRVLIHEHRFTVAGARDRLEELIAIDADGEAVWNAVTLSALPSTKPSGEIADESPSFALEASPPVEIDEDEDTAAAPLTASSTESDTGEPPTSAPPLTTTPASTNAPQLSFETLAGVEAQEYVGDTQGIFDRPRADLAARIRVLESELSSALRERAQLRLRLDAATEVLEDTRAEFEAQSVRGIQAEEVFRTEERKLRAQLELTHTELHAERTRAQALFTELEGTRARVAEGAAHRLVLEARLRDAEAESVAAKTELAASEEARASLQARFDERASLYIVAQGHMMSARQEAEELREELAASEEARAALQARFDERASLYIVAQGHMMSARQEAEELREELEELRAELGA